MDQPLALTFGNTLPQTWQYTSSMRRLQQTSVGTGGIFDRQYTYDPVGNIASILDRNATDDTQTFTSGHRDRLTSVTGPTATNNDTFTYDAIDNLLQKNGQPYSYDANGNGTGGGPHQVRTRGGWASTDAANGNLTSHNGHTYTWTSDNRPSRTTIPNIADESYTYDADGERLTRTADDITTVHLAGGWAEEIATSACASIGSLISRMPST